MSAFIGFLIGLAVGALLGVACPAVIVVGNK